jgi:transcription initiation factor TFIIIB Brf1 subunit/transcription initiation factor TFIIB
MARTGSLSSLANYDMGPSTIIENTNRDVNGQVFNASVNSTIERLRIWNSRILVCNPKDKNSRHAFQQPDILK